jgi:glucokinase
VTTTSDRPALTIDIGGTKLAAAIVTPEGEIVDRCQAPTEASTRDGEALYAALVELVQGVLDGHAARGGAPPAVCGVGTGGPMTGGGEAISPMNIGGWRNFPLRRRLRESLALPVHIDNDAKALALGEGWIGGAVGVPDFIAMVVSTGVGGGIVLDGRLLDGRDGNAGHIGHITVEPDGRPCRCGNHGCLEAEASGTAIAAITGRPAAEAGPDVVERVGTLVGRAVSAVAVLLDLRLALVAGSVALGYGEPFFAAAQAEIDRRACLDYAVGCTIGPGLLGDRGPLIGAAAVGFRGLGRPWTS